MIEYQWRHITVREYPEKNVIIVQSSHWRHPKPFFTNDIQKAVAAFKARMR